MAWVPGQAGASPRRKRATLAIAICNIRSRAARLPPAMCGVTITWGKSAKGLPPGRSSRSTSRAAPPEFATHKSAAESCLVEYLAA